MVFLTAYDQFAIQAFGAQALDYLVKPVSQARFAATMKRLIRHSRRRSRQRENLAVAPRAGADGARVMEIVGSKRRATMRGSGWANAATCICRGAARARAGAVRGHGFVRAHRRALVRIRSILGLRWTDASTLVAILGSGSDDPAISRRRRAAFDLLLALRPSRRPLETAPRRSKRRQGAAGYRWQTGQK